MRVRITLPTNDDGDTTRLDLREVESKLEGKRIWQARCKLPIEGLLSLRDVSVRPVEQTVDADVERSYHDDDKDKRDEHGDDDAMRASDEIVLEGIASSSSTDWHGTSMSLAALQNMARQFKAGVPYVATHHDAEWMDMLGRTFDAEVVSSTAARAAYGEDAAYELRVRTTLYTDDERSRVLLALLRRGVPVGWSIGGWFTELEVVTNDSDEIEAMVVRGVELDHLATTRTPSNPDSFVASIASDTSEALRAARSRTSVEATRRPNDVRHVWKVVETEDSVHVVFGKSENDWEGVHTLEASSDESSDESSDDETVERAVERAATSFADLPLADVDTSWDWNADTANEILYADGGSEDEPNWSLFERAHLWVDDERRETRDGYKLPIAMMIDGELHAVPRAVIAALAALNGARGGVDIPDDDREDVYAQIVAYYAKWGDDEPPELRSVSDEALVVERAVASYHGLPLDVSSSWSWNDAAADEVLGESNDWQRFQLAHLVYDPARPNERDAYEYPFARMIDGEFVAVLDAVRSLLDALHAGELELGEPDRAKAIEHLSRYTSSVDEAALDRAPLDSRSRLCSPTVEGIDARRSAPPADTSPTHAEDAAMSDTPVDTHAAAPDASPSSDRLDRIESLLLRTVEALTTNPQPVAEPAPEPVVEQSDDSEVVELRARLAAMEQRMVALAQTPQRRGRPHVSHVVPSAPTTAFESFVRSAESHLPSGSALVTVCREQAGRRSADLAELPSRQSLEADLRAVLHAALADGVITDPDARAAWR